MEYNLRTLTGLGVAAYRPKSEGDYHDLCYALPDKYQLACAFGAYTWWLTFSTDTPLNRIARIGDECRAFRTTQMRDACYMGVGDHYPVAPGRATKDIRTLCENLSTEVGGQLLCKGFAAAISLQLNGTKAEGICDDLQGTALTFCKKYADGEANWLHVEPVPVEYR